MSYAPDGLGRATEATSAGTVYASGAGYHPSGQLAALSFGNGFAYTATFTARQQPLRTKSVRGSTAATDYQYSYDPNGLILSVNDRTSVNDDRTYTYDNLGRLKTASGPWGAASYSYDRLNNITAKQLGSRTVDTQYTTDTNRLRRYRDSGGDNQWHYLGYDERGNVIDTGKFTFTYDDANQPTAMVGTGADPLTASFQYDGNYKRVKQDIDGE